MNTTLAITDARGQYLTTAAVAFAIEAMSRLPDVYRPDSNIQDYKELLEQVSPRDLAFYQNEARRLVTVLLGEPV